MKRILGNPSTTLRMSGYWPWGGELELTYSDKISSADDFWCQRLLLDPIEPPSYTYLKSPFMNQSGIRKLGQTFQEPWSENFYCASLVYHFVNSSYTLWHEMNFLKTEPTYVQYLNSQGTRLVPAESISKGAGRCYSQRFYSVRQRRKTKTSVYRIDSSYEQYYA